MVPGGAGLPRNRSLAALPELVEHVAQHEASAGVGAGAASVGSTATESTNSDEAAHQLVRPDTLPEGLRPW